MTESESPGAMAAAHGTSKIDQLGGKVGHENSLSILTAQPLPLRAGIVVRSCIRNAAADANSIAAIGAATKPAGVAILQFQVLPGGGSPAVPRSVENRPLVSTSCKDGFVARTPSIIAPRVVIATENHHRPNLAVGVACVRRGGR
jgi:hypothetical protein